MNQLSVLATDRSVPNVWIAVNIRLAMSLMRARPSAGRALGFAKRNSGERADPPGQGGGGSALAAAGHQAEPGSGVAEAFGRGAFVARRGVV